MNTEDIVFVLRWWLVLFLIGITFLPLAIKLFPKFVDRGYAVSKTLGIVCLSYITFLLGLSHILPFTWITLLTVSIIFAIILWGRLLIKKQLPSLRSLLPIFLLEEMLFLLGLFFLSYIRSFSPDIHGLEKYMDYGFMNSILRSEYFPPKDMWFSPFSINYYYFGHLITAVITKLSGIPSNISYNLMLATIFGLCFSSSFSLGMTLLHPLLQKNRRTLSLLGVGLFTALLVTLSGNLHTVYTLFRPYENEKPVPFWELGDPLIKTEDYYDTNGHKQTRFVQSFTDDVRILSKHEYLKIIPNIASPNPCFGKTDLPDCGETKTQPLLISYPNSYWYPNATRFIYNTIHEFPMYSWTVADLHGHVLDIPIVLLTLSLLYSLFLAFAQEKAQKKLSLPFSMSHSLQKCLTPYAMQFEKVMFLSFLLAVMYMTNAWDGLIYLLFAMGIFLFFAQKQQKSFRSIFFQTCIGGILIGGGFILFSLPFSLFFKPFVSGIGILCAPTFLTNMGKIGPFLFEADHCQKSPLWQLLILHGFFLIFIVSFFIFLRKIKKIQLQDTFVLLLITLSLILIIIPEFVYAKDIYPQHYRANTMFKLVFESFIMLSIATAYIVFRITPFIRRAQKTPIRIFGIFCYYVVLLSAFSLIFSYPFLAIKSYYGELKTYTGLNGTKYLQSLYPTDYEAIQWINKTIKGQPVILEAQFDSYTDYARVSANTGLPTVLGWTVHEWLWRGDYAIPAPRIPDVIQMYESTDVEQTKDLLKKYTVSFVFVGDLEREKYKKLNEEKFLKLGKLVYQNKGTKIYQIR